MPKQSISYLKSLFITGARPIQQWWHDMFDSFVHKDDLAAINQSVIDSSISAYDNNLKSLSADGKTNTLGDLFKIFQNYSDTRDINAELKWGGIPGRPTEAIQLNYSEIQRVALWNINLADWPATGGTSSSRVKTIKQLLSLPEPTSIVIVDMHIVRVSVVDTTGATVTIHSLNMIDIGVTPKTPV